MSGIVDVDVNLQLQQAVVEHLPEWVDEAGLIAAIKDAGYSSRVVARDIYTEPGDTPAPCCCG
jgi:hypothetical protein